MTDSRMALADLIEKGGDADFLREVLAFSLQRLMDLEAEAACPPVPMILRQRHRESLRKGAYGR